MLSIVTNTQTFTAFAYIHDIVFFFFMGVVEICTFMGNEDVLRNTMI